MSYVDSNLLAGETVLHRARLHGIVLVWPVAIGVFFGIGALGALAMALFGGAETREMRTPGVMMFLGEALVAVVAIGSGVLRRNATEMAVTNRRLVAKAGILRRHTLELTLERVESVSVEQGMLGRMLGYGTIVVRGTGGTFEVFRSIAAPLDFRREVQAQIDRALHGAPGGGSAAAPIPAGPPPARGGFCPHCGTAVAGVGKFCAACGAALPAPPA